MIPHFEELLTMVEGVVGVTVKRGISSSHEQCPRHTVTRHDACSAASIERARLAEIKFLDDLYTRFAFTFAADYLPAPIVVQSAFAFYCEVESADDSTVVFDVSELQLMVAFAIDRLAGPVNLLAWVRAKLEDATYRVGGRSRELKPRQREVRPLSAGTDVDSSWNVGRFAHHFGLQLRYVSAEATQRDDNLDPAPF